MNEYANIFSDYAFIGQNDNSTQKSIKLVLYDDRKKTRGHEIKMQI